jgi:hypothetical protein
VVIKEARGRGSGTHISRCRGKKQAQKLIGNEASAGATESREQRTREQRTEISEQRAVGKRKPR